MQVSFNPKVSVNNKSQNPQAFKAVIPELLRDCKEDSCEALNCSLILFKMQHLSIPNEMQNLKDTMLEALNLDYVYGENGKKIWKNWIVNHVDPYLSKK